jgi:hypothetical protein
MRTIKTLWAAICLNMVVLLTALSPPSLVRAQATLVAAPPAQQGGCGYALSGTIAGAWRDLGGEQGRLGCPTTSETPGQTSPQGSADRVVTFGQNGLIVLAVTGPRAGQAFAVSGGCFRLYVQFGGTSGWLGLPISDQENTPDGSLQRFEGGVMRWARAIDECQAEPSTAPPPTTAAAAEPATPLDLFENLATGDRLSLAAGGSVDKARAAGYQLLRGQARVFTTEAPGMARLKLYVNDANDLRETLATPQSEREALAADFVFEAGQGWVWIDPRPGAVTLKLYRNNDTGRTSLTASPQDEQDASAKGYHFVRIEGYALPPS